MGKRESAEYENFDRTMRELMKVPHSEIKAASGRRENGERETPEEKRPTT